MGKHQLNGDVQSLVHYLRPALDDLRHMELGFESYLLEMLIIALRDREIARPANGNALRDTGAQV